MGAVQRIPSAFDHERSSFMPEFSVAEFGPFMQNVVPMRYPRFLPALILLAIVCLFGPGLWSNLHADFMARDPGPRGAPVGAGNAIPGLTDSQAGFFEDGLLRFGELNSVSGNLLGEVGVGLGPGFNSNSCASCHSQPTTGGSSPSTHAYPFVGPNPQVAVATLDGASNTVPFFITGDGPVREARFKYFLASTGSLSSERDGGVHNVFTIQGRTDATNVPGLTGTRQSCEMAQPDFEQMQTLNNLSLRIPTPLFGDGFIENISEATLTANLESDGALKTALGIRGHFNRNPNDGTISRFGWKAQNKSLQLFSAEAESVEMGVSNEVFPNEHGYAPVQPPASCLFNPTPEDHTEMEAGNAGPAVVSNAVEFANFMRFLAQPRPSCSGAGCPQNVQNGRSLFNSTGCGLCHTPSLKTTVSYFSQQLSNADANLFSDLAVHHMGSGLADNIIQGTAGPDEFRTAPLWGLGQRVFFLHDGRTQDLVQAIEQHASPGSEANGAVNRYRQLSEPQKQDLLDFLRSL
jgi:CxxC motif-containing protein (DUF1111 family)